jgi:hypothetical protein
MLILAAGGTFSVGSGDDSTQGRDNRNEIFAVGYRCEKRIGI